MKNFIIILFLAFCGLGAHAQSLTLTDLTNLATLSVNDGSDFLTHGHPFKQIYTQTVNGLPIMHFQGTTALSKKETVVIGDGYKTNNGQLLHIVNYTATNKDYVLKLITQAKEAGLHKNFFGVDKYSNVYVFDSYMFTVRIFIKNDGSSGNVQVKENDFVDYK